jgi:F0F1-type ATP synthase membrane subunit b/b'
LTQRFLVSLKKLQRAVHRRETNVTSEKLEFEESRKELEATLKQVKRELD